MILPLLLFFACNDDDNGTERLDLLTAHVWQSDQLLVNDVDASGPGQMLEAFKGEARFNRDGTGTFGSYTGTWNFAQNQTQLVIQSPSLDFPLITNIVELTATSLVITTSIPNPEAPQQPFNIRMSFIPK